MKTDLQQVSEISDILHAANNRAYCSQRRWAWGGAVRVVLLAVFQGQVIFKT